MTVCESQVQLDFYQLRPLVVKFSDLDLSSDAGLMLACQAEEQLCICQGLADCIEEWRDPLKLIHTLPQLVRQRVFQLLAGYEDADDSDALRHDPIYKMVCARLPIAGEELLASQPTISRLENHVTVKEIAQMRRLFIERFIDSHSTAPDRITLDIDAWDAPTYGEQELSKYHGYYGHQMYFPVLINEASSGFPLVAQLRAGNTHSGKGIKALLRWLFWRLRRAWPGVNLELRADAGFALPELLTLCERYQVNYAFGIAGNAVLKSKIANLLEQARVVCCLSGQKVRFFDDVYYAAQSWSEPRRVVMKAEYLLKGENPRFVVTNLELEPQQLYDQFYVARGATSEHPIKELKRGIKAGRFSCRTFRANQFRLLLAQGAYLLMLSLRWAARGTQFEHAQVERLRSCLIKGAARVKVSARRVLVELASYCPFAPEIQLIAQRLCDPLTFKLR